MLVVQSARLENSLAEVHPVGILFNAQEHFPSGGRAIDERSPERLQALEVVAVHMAEKACEGRRPIRVFAKVVNCETFQQLGFIHRDDSLELTLNKGKFCVSLLDD